MVVWLVGWLANNDLVPTNNVGVIRPMVKVCSRPPFPSFKRQSRVFLLCISPQCLVLVGNSACPRLNRGVVVLKRKTEPDEMLLI
jgi:hypothetical protein